MAICIAMAVGAPGAATAADEYVFDPTLSLTGGCTTSTVDTVPDPGLCPMPPGVPGVDHPPASFTNPQAITTDVYGNIYVASYGLAKNEGKEGRIDIFDPEGFYIGELKAEGPIDIAVDSEGVLYVVERPLAFLRVVRYAPTAPYNPASGEVAYSSSPTVVAQDFVASGTSIAVNPLDDHLFIHYGTYIVERAAADEGNSVLDESIGKGLLQDEAISLAIDAAHDRLYASDTPASKGVVRVFKLSGSHELLATFNGSETPAGDFGIKPALAADEETGNFFVFDGAEDGSNAVEAFDEEGKYLFSISEPIKDIGNVAGIWVDNGANSPNGGGPSSEGRYLYVPSHPSGVGHSFAYGPSAENEPEVEALTVAEVSRADAEFRATINPGNLPTDYVFEYITQQRYEEEGNSFSGASIAGTGQIPAGKAGVAVLASATGLSPETTYRFRVVASNELGSDESEGEFTTYPVALPLPQCSNASLRTGFSAVLSDCRAYELVTPPDTNARSPFGLSHLGIYFPTLQTSHAGDKVSFQIQGGVIPGYEGTGSFGGDPYLSSRTAGGWSTSLAGPDGTETGATVPGSVSPDQGHSFWNTGNDKGSAVVPGGDQTTYIRYPAGNSELVGRGSEGTDPRAEGKLISENGEHILFISGTTAGPAIQLEPDAPPNGTTAIYDRTSDEVTHVISLLPGDQTPGAGENALYRGASLDGVGVAFSIGSKLYLRYDNDETYEIGSGVAFAGVAEGGKRIFYVESGDLKAFDVDAGSSTAFSSSGDITPVNIAPNGTAAYFVSPSVLAGPNPNGAEPEAGKENLYLSEEGTMSFVGTVTQRDVDGEFVGVEEIEGLGLWLLQVSERKAAQDPSRTTPDGAVLLFESRADLDGYDPEGHTQVYRYDSIAGDLDCLSCIPTGLPADGDASLQSLNLGQTDPEPLNSFDLTTNLRADGRRAFFQSEEALVPEDTDGLQDVYEWEDQGVGSCTRSGGCIYLISSGQSERIDYLYAVSDSGDDVFFRSSDLLVPTDSDETPSIYDARVNGGFAEEATSCQEDQICRGTPSNAPVLPAPVTPVTGKAAAPQPKTCPKGKKKVKRKGKMRCVKKHRKHHQKKSGMTKKGGSK
jgi:hypothetical protein